MEQFESVRCAARSSGVSMNQWILDRLVDMGSVKIVVQDAPQSHQVAIWSVVDPKTEKEPEVLLCRSCEGGLRLVHGRMVCVESACSMRGLEQ